jgi:hypothetical protein
MSRRIISNIQLCLYISAVGLHNTTFTEFVQVSLREVLKNIVDNVTTGLKYRHLPENPNPFLQVEIHTGAYSFVVCCKVVGSEYKIVNVNWKELKHSLHSLEAQYFMALEKELIDMPEEIDPQSQYVLRDWLHFPGDLEGAEFRKLEGDTLKTLDTIFNTDMADLPKGEYGQPGLFKVRIFTPNARDMSHLDAVVRVD